MRTYQVKVLIVIDHTLDVQVEEDDDMVIGQAALDEVDEILANVKVDSYTTEVLEIREVVDFPKR